jgi:hypothetical protein
LDDLFNHNFGNIRVYATATGYQTDAKTSYPSLIQLIKAEALDLFATISIEKSECAVPSCEITSLFGQILSLREIEYLKREDLDNNDYPPWPDERRRQDLIKRCNEILQCYTTMLKTLIAQPTNLHLLQLAKVELTKLNSLPPIDEVGHD